MKCSLIVRFSLFGILETRLGNLRSCLHAEFTERAALGVQYGEEHGGNKTTFQFTIGLRKVEEQEK